MSHALETPPLYVAAADSIAVPPSLETELDEELRHRVDRQTEANIASGMAEPEAHRASLRSLGGIELRRECRDAFRWRMLDALRLDGTHATRRLAKDWPFSACAIAILALGIGANTAVFSILNSTLFQPHPFTSSKDGFGRAPAPSADGSRRAGPHRLRPTRIGP